MMSPVLILLSVLFVSGRAMYDPRVPSAANPIEQFSNDNDADTTSGFSNSGNGFGVGSITDLPIAGGDFGVGVGQQAGHNTANSESGDASSGNIVGVGQIQNSSVVTDQIADRNFAESDSGDANAGNEALIPGGIEDSEVDLNALATYNTAISDTGDANAGNIFGIGSVTGTDFGNSQEAIGNTAESNTGLANSGNIISLGNLSGRKLLKTE